eukprot:Amastigsp_a342908_32.p2 type:complete len:165 gc:universal Amastigsp_a342908_32:543-1037(+)
MRRKGPACSTPADRESRPHVAQRLIGESREHRPDDELGHKGSVQKRRARNRDRLVVDRKQRVLGFCAATHTVVACGAHRRHVLAEGDAAMGLHSAPRGEPLVVKRKRDLGLGLADLGQILDVRQPWVDDTVLVAAHERGATGRREHACKVGDRELNDLGDLTHA